MMHLLRHMHLCIIHMIIIKSVHHHYNTLKDACVLMTITAALVNSRVQNWKVTCLLQDHTESQITINAYI